MTAVDTSRVNPPHPRAGVHHHAAREGVHGLALTARMITLTFGAAPGLNATNFTLEAWVKRLQGVATTTQTGILVDVTRRCRILSYQRHGRGQTAAPTTPTTSLEGCTPARVYVGADFEDNAGAT